jgi:hypothetical protein
VPFGPDVVTLVTHVDGSTVGELGTYTQTEVTIELPGCHHRPMTFTETAEAEFNIGTEPWKTTVPIREYSESVREALAAAQANDTLRVGGREYNIIAGVRVHSDFSGPFKATIVSEKHTG